MLCPGPLANNWTFPTALGALPEVKKVIFSLGSPLYLCFMRRALFMLTLVLYAWGTMEMHEWVRVPHVVAHILVHHSFLGHHDPDFPGHHHTDVPDQEHSHSPFNDGCHDDFCVCGGMALIATFPKLTIQLPRHALKQFFHYPESDICSFSGTKWNPPKA